VFSGIVLDKPRETPGQVHGSTQELGGAKQAKRDAKAGGMDTRSGEEMFKSTQAPLAARKRFGLTTPDRGGDEDAIASIMGVVSSILPDVTDEWLCESAAQLRMLPETEPERTFCF
jgi:hypothetical protein